MKILVTSAFPLSEEERLALEKEHEICTLKEEKGSLADLQPFTPPEQIEGIVCNFFFLYHTLDELPSLRWIQLTSAGLDRVPVEEIRRRGIVLNNAGATYAVPMAEWTVLQILNILKDTEGFCSKQRMALWQKNRDMGELAGKTVLLLGCGNYGRALAGRLKAFDTTVMAADIIPVSDPSVDEYIPMEGMYGALERANIAVLSLPLLPETEYLADETFFDHMQPGSVLVNAARGKLIRKEALIAALESGKLRGAALDVFEEEPLPKDSRLWGQRGLYITPHNAFVGEGNHERLFRLIARNLEAVC